MREGPEDALTLTENAQPAIMANAIAVLRVLEKECGIALADKADFVAGHSLGEYTALCAAGAFSLADTARLLKLRGQAMQAAVPVGVGAMCALLGARYRKGRRRLPKPRRREGEVCTVANDNDPTQVVLSGHAGAIERAIALVKEHGHRARHAAARVGAVPLPADAARRRCHGRSARTTHRRRRCACRSSPMSLPRSSPTPPKSARCWSSR